MASAQTRIDPQAASRLARHEEKLEVLLQSERWSRAEIREWQDERLAELGSHARRSRFYSERLPERLGLDSLAEVPPLTRRELRERGEELDTGLDSPRIERLTSGTSGRPVRVVQGPDVLGWDLAGRRRHQTRFGLPPTEQSEAGFAVAGSPGDPPVRRTGEAPARFLLNHLRLDDDTLPEVHAELLAAGGATLTGAWPSMVDGWARLYERSGLDARELGLRLAILGAEISTREQRRRIGAVFGCAIGEIYGMREVPVIASECSEGSFHVNEERVAVEILGPDGEPLGDGEVGEIVATLLHSHEMPIIRYRTGDAGSRSPGPCPCGRTLSRLDLSVGRLEDMAMRADGSLVNARFVRATYEQLLGEAVRGHRTEQLGPGRFAARLELDGAAPSGLANALAEHLSAHLGEPIRVELEIGPVPDREPGRKLRTFRRRWEG